MGKTIEIAGVCIEQEQIEEKINELLVFIPDEDLADELEYRGFEVLYPEDADPKNRTIRDEDLYEAFLLAKEKYTYEELLNRLK
jgi:hypothetical protein